MGCDSRHRDDIPRRTGEDLAEELARNHRLELAHARKTLRRAEQAAAEDPQARSVQQWFVFLVDDEARSSGAAGKRTLRESVEAVRGTRSAPPQDQAKLATGRQTLVMSEGREKDTPVKSSRHEAQRSARPHHDVALEWRTRESFGFELSGVAIRRPGSTALDVDTSWAAPSTPLAQILGQRFEIARGAALGEVALLALDAFASGRLSDSSLVSALLLSPPRPTTSRRPAPLPRRLHGTLDPFAAAGGALLPGPPRATNATAALMEVAERRAVTIFRRELADADVDLHEPAIEAALQRTGRGEPLPETVRQEMEARLGADFGRVRIHTDAVAASAAAALAASAFTVGEDVFFAGGAFDPMGEEGRRLLVHELTHVVQAQEGRVPTSHGTEVSQPTDALEQEAAAAYDRSAARVPAPNAHASAASPPLPGPGMATLPRSGMLLRHPGGKSAKPGTPQAPGRNVPWLSWDAKLVIGFIDGLLRTAGSGFTPEAWAKIERDFTDLPSLGEIYQGLLTGFPEGAWESLTDNVKSLAQVGEWVFWNLTPAGTVRDLYEWIVEPEEKWARELEKQQHQQDFIEGMVQLIVHIAMDPGIMADLGEELGQAAGDYVAQRYLKFANAAPYQKGNMLGRGIGYVAVEIAALFVGPEILIEKVPAAIAKLGVAGGKAAQALLRLMEKIPALRKLLKAAGRIGEKKPGAGPAKAWDDPTLTLEEFIESYRSKYPHSSLKDEKAFEKRFVENRRLNPETGRLKRTRYDPPPGFTRADLPLPGSPKYEQWKQWKPGDPDALPCFPAGTPVHTPTGMVAIDSLQVGDAVLAWDRTRGCVVSFVTALYRNYAEEMMKIETVHGSVDATTNHPFWVVDRSEWLAAARLEPGMVLQLADGSTTQVRRTLQFAAQESTFNVTVDRYHTYYVSIQGALVHNAGVGDSAYANPFTRDTHIYAVVDKNTNKVVYVGKTTADPDVRLGQHVNDKRSALYIEDDVQRANFEAKYKMEHRNGGKWTVYEANVWEQYYMDVERAKGATLLNRQEGIDWEKGKKYAEMHNPCRNLD